MRVTCSASQRLSESESRSLLGVPRDASKGQIRAAYVAKMKQLHPDVNPDAGATAAAAQLNAAYDVLLAAAVPSLEDSGAGFGGQWGDFGDVFDFPDGVPCELFVNPFACQVPCRFDLTIECLEDAKLVLVMSQLQHTTHFHGLGPL